MWIEHGNVYCRLTRGDDDERRWLAEYLTFPDATARHRGASDSKVRMFNALADTFASGLLPLVTKAARAAGRTIEVIERRSPTGAVVASPDLAWLRDYQREGVERVLAKKRGILHLTTGAGKTEIAVGLTRAVDARWLFLVHRKDLMDQAAARYELRTQLRAGRIGEGQWTEAAFTSATFATLKSALDRGDRRLFDLLERTEGVIIDECHTLPAESHWRILTALRNAYWRVGLSGTPLARTDRKSLLAIAGIGPVIHRVRPDVLIEAGVLAKPRIHVVECRQKSEAKTWAGVYSECIVRSAKRNRLVVEAVKRAPPGPLLVFVKEVAHGKALEKLLWQHGRKPEFVHGVYSLEARQRKVRDLVAGRIDVLICSVIFQEGIDIPELQSVVVASAGKSTIATLQRLGRGMRAKDSHGNLVKTTFDVYDFADYGCGCAAAAKALGTPGVGVHRGCKWLDRHTKDRLKAYAGDGHQTTVEQWVIPVE